MSTRFLPVLGLIALWAAPAQAQTAPAPQDKSAMERAQREADGPRRRILEAARLRTVVARVPDGAPVTVPVPAPAAPTRSASARSEAAEPEVPTAVLAGVAPPLPLQAAPETMAPVAAVAPVALAPVTPAMVEVPRPALDATLPPPRLLSRVDPELPAYMVRRGLRRTELVVQLTVNPDGSVRDVAVPESRYPELEAAVVEAVRQWRYEPQPAPRPQTLRLVVAPSI